MSASVSSQPMVKKKQVRFASMEDDDDNDDQEEDTLFDKRKDVRKGFKSMLKSNVNKKLTSGGFDSVKVVGGGRGTNDPGVCGRWMITLTVCASFLGLGMGISVLGPTLEDLAINVNKNISNISYIFVGRSSGYIGGSLLGGMLFDCINPHLLLGFSMLFTAFGMFAVPFCKNALFLTALMSCVGISMGFLDTGGNVLILNIWGAQAGPIMQALHFSFAVGAFVSPIIAKLVFGKHHAKAANSTLDASSPLADKMVQTLNSLIHFSPGNSEALSSMFAYFVIGAFILFLSLAFFILYSCGTPSKDRSQSASGAPLVAKRHNVLICLLAIFFFWYVGAEVAYGSFIFTYAKDYANMTQDESAGLNSLFWGTFAATRGLAIFFAACLYPGTMILLSLVGCTVSSFLLTRFHKNRLALWSCTALYGASMATTFPSGISWVEQYTTLTGRSASVFVVGAALGEMVLPAVLGFLLGNATLQQYPLLMILCLLTAVVTSILFPVMYKLAAAPTTPAGKRPRVRGREADDGEDRKALLDSGGNEDDDEEEEADEGDEEADHWNDADFEVIEMDDASLMSSPNKVASPPDVTMSAAAVPSIDPFSLPALSESPSKYVSSSPRRKLLVTLDREKND